MDFMDYDGLQAKVRQLRDSATDIRAEADTLERTAAATAWISGGASLFYASLRDDTAGLRRVAVELEYAATVLSQHCDAAHAQEQAVVRAARLAAAEVVDATKAVVNGVGADVHDVLHAGGSIVRRLGTILP